jgi:hypothetical protein
LKNLPFQRPGRFFKGNLHTHSTVSDGSLPPEDVISLYRQHGYDFLAITDHFRDRFGFPPDLGPGEPQDRPPANSEGHCRVLGLVHDDVVGDLVNERLTPAQLAQCLPG